MPLLSSEQKNAKFGELDVKRIPFPHEYLKHTKIIEIGRKLVGANFDNQNRLQSFIDKEVEGMFKLNSLEKRLIEQWEKMTKRKKMGNNTKGYEVGFKHMLDSFNLPKPKKWEPQVKNGVEVISFSESDKLPQMDDKIREKINNIVIGKKDVDFQFITDNQGIIMRRKKNNYGFLTGLADAEFILSSLQFYA